MKMLILVTIIFCFGSLNAQIPITPGEEYPGGTRLTMPSMGVTFTLPSDWTGGMPVDGQAVMLGSKTKPGIGLIIVQTKVTQNEIEQYLNAPQDLGGGVILSPAGAVELSGSKIRMNYTGSMYIGRLAGLMGTADNSVLFFFAGLSSESAYYDIQLEKLVSSVKFTQPQTGGLDQEWRQLLTGMMLKKMDSHASGGYDGSYGGYSSQETIHLCSDGGYAYSSSSSVTADGGGGTSGYSSDSAEQYGEWHIEILGTQARLILQSHDGTVGRFLLRFDGEKTFLDGERVFRVPSDRCR